MELFPWEESQIFPDGLEYYDLPDYDRVIRSIFTPRSHRGL